MSAKSPERPPIATYTPLSSAHRRVQVQQAILLTSATLFISAMAADSFLFPTQPPPMALRVVGSLAALGVLVGLVLEVFTAGYWNHLAACNLTALDRMGFFAASSNAPWLWHWRGVRSEGLTGPYRATKELLVHSFPGNENPPVGGYDPALDDPALDEPALTAPLVHVVPLWIGLDVTRYALIVAAMKLHMAGPPGTPHSSLVDFPEGRVLAVAALAAVVGFGAAALNLQIMGKVAADQNALARAKGLIG